MSAFNQFASLTGLRHIFTAAITSLLILGLPTAWAQDDPSTAPLPDLNDVLGDTRRALVVEALIFGDGTAVAGMVAVSTTPPRARLGNPPLILVEWFDKENNPLGEMNAWDPRWEFQETSDGGEKMEIQPEGLGQFVIPFDHAIAFVTISDQQTDEELITVNVTEEVQAFCIENPDHPECEGFEPNRMPTANAGGPYSVIEGGSVVLSGAASSDPDGDLLAFLWDFDQDGVLGESGSDAENGDEIGSTPSFVATDLTAPDIIDVVLEVCDPGLLCDQDLTTVEVLPSDRDGDGVLDAADNCPDAPNPHQADFDGDGLGDVCDADVDGDGVANDDDQCAQTEENNVVDSAGCAIEQYCPCAGPRDTAQKWKNQGQYTRCVAKTAESFADQLLITEAEKDATVARAAKSYCGLDEAN